MALAYVNGGAAASGTTSAAVPQPASPASGNAYVAHIGNKPYTSTPTTTGAYTQRGTGTSGSVANGNGTGSVRATSFTHKVSGSESGNITFSTTSGSPTIGRMQQFSCASGKTFGYAATVLADTDETGTGVSATGTQIDIASGDMLSICVMIKDDVPTHTSQALSVPGCTLGSVTWETRDVTTSGNDMAIYLGRVSVTAGSATGAPTYTATSSVSGASSTAVSIVRLREVDPPPVAAVEFDASGEEFTDTWSLGAKSAFTVACWMRADFNPLTWHGPWQITNSGVTDYCSLACQSDGVQFGAWNETTGLGYATLTVGTWYFVMVATNGTTSTLYYAADGVTTLTSVSLTNIGSTPFDEIWLGHGEGSGDWFRGSMCGWKAWDAALTQAEGETELTQKLAVRTTNLLASYGMEGTSDTADQSGNGRDLTGGSGAAGTDGPNVPRGTLGGAVTLPPRPLIIQQAVPRSYSY